MIVATAVALLKAEEHLALVGDRQIYLVKADKLDRVGRVGWRLQRYIQVLFREIPFVLGEVDAGMIGVRHPVQFH